MKHIPQSLFTKASHFEQRSPFESKKPQSSSRQSVSSVRLKSWDNENRKLFTTQPKYSTNGDQKS